MRECAKARQMMTGIVKREKREREDVRRCGAKSRDVADDGGKIFVNIYIYGLNVQILDLTNIFQSRLKSEIQ